MARWQRVVCGLVRVDVVVGGPLGFSTIKVQPAWRGRTRPDRTDAAARKPEQPH